MSQRPESGGQGSSGRSAALPFLSASPVLQGSETVVHVDRGGSKAESGAEYPAADLLQRLFPLQTGSSVQTRRDAAQGVRLDHFEIEERIGVGGMGSVFRAVDRRLERIVALKVLSPSQSVDPSSVQRFLNEARASARLDHDSIARVFYVGDDQGLHFIAYEHIVGTNVRDLIRERGRLDPAEAVNYTLQIASALNHTSAAGVVHRDIKPSNIIITPGGRAKLVDLGLARKQNADGVADLTIAGTTLGTFDYISPEQAKDPRNVDVRSDIYSLGCTLYHMLTGEPPYPEGTVLQKLLDHQGKEPPDPARINKRVPPELSAVVRKMMSSDPRRRYARPDLLIRELLLVAERLGMRALSPDATLWPGREPGSRFWQRNAGWFVTAAALIAIVVLLDRFPSNWIRSPGLGIGTASNDSPAVDPKSAHLPVAVVPVVEGHGPATSEPETPRAPTGSNSNGSAPVTDPAVVASTGSSGSDDPLLTDPRTKPLTVGLPTPLPNPATGSPGETPPSGPATADPLPGTTPPVDVAVRPTGPSLVEPKVPPPVAADESPIAIVGRDGQSSRPFPTLEAACSAAEDGDVIELRFNGHRRENPIRVVKKKLTIRGAIGFRPFLEFRHVDVPAEGSVIRMIAVTSGSVDLINVDLQMTVDPQVVFDDRFDHWALFSMDGPQRISLQGTTVSVTNPANVPATVFELLPESELGSMSAKMVKPGQMNVPKEFEIRVFESFVRGGRCDLVVAKQARKGRVEIERSACAVQGTLLQILGEDEPPMDGEDVHFDLKLDHVTALTTRGVLRIDSGTMPRRVPHVRASARNSILASASDQPLIAMTGATDGVEFRERTLLWDAEKTFYDRYATFWSISTAQGTTDFEPLDFVRWKEHWRGKEVGTQSGGVSWKANWAGKPFAAIVADDIGLNHTSRTNPAVAGASDGTDAGVDPTHLPAFPPPPPKPID